MAVNPPTRVPTPPKPPRGPAGGGNFPGPGRPNQPTSASSAPSTGLVLAVIIMIAASALIAIAVTPKPPSIMNPTFSIWSGFFIGLFGCTLLLGLLQSFVQRQEEVGTYSDWNIPVSKVTIAKILTAIGWVAGAVNCYLIAYNMASRIG
jgi:hypothetical protein